MTGRSIVALVSGVLLASLTTLPGVACAGAPRVGMGAGFPGAVRRPFGANPFVHRPFVHHRFVRPFVPFGAIAPPVVIYTLPPFYNGSPSEFYGTPAYSALPDLYGAPAGGAVTAAPAPPLPSVVQYSTGGYELRGDGLTTAYRWVWIPNPPPAPPPETPPSAPPTSSNAAPPRHTRVYRWTDDQGVAHWSDQPNAVPAQYRAQASRTQLD